MSTLFLFLLFAFIAFATWLGYVGYRAMERRRGPVPPGKSPKSEAPQDVAEEQQRTQPREVPESITPAELEETDRPKTLDEPDDPEQRPPS